MAVVAQTETDLLQIRNEVQATDKKLKEYRKTHQEIEGISLEGTRATYHSEGTMLKKIDAHFYGETYDATGAFYYRGGQLLFVYQTITSYNGYAWKKPMPEVVGKREQRLYFKDGKLIRYLDGKEKKEIKQDDPDFRATETETLEISQKLIEAWK